MKPAYKDATNEELNQVMETSRKAFSVYRNRSLDERASLMERIAEQLAGAEKELLEVAASETNLDIARLKVELKRTLFQLTSYAAACRDGRWLDIRIDRGDVHRNPPKPDLRKMLVPLGPVVVFGASNFPFAYSTAGGDTACALAAGCTVVVKAHPAHAHTSELVARVIQSAVAASELPEGVFQHVHGASFETGKYLVEHPLTRAVGFTGSFAGGKALFDLASKRSMPIPVFAEMGSVNPVFLLPGKLREDAQGIASMYAASITQSVGQFCTNPGLLIAIEGEELKPFVQLLAREIAATRPQKMLHPGIANAFHEKRKSVLQEDGVEVLGTSELGNEDESQPTLATVSASKFISNPVLHQEVFGPFSLLVKCMDMKEMMKVAEVLEGQLTTSLIATSDEVKEQQDLVESLKELCGRLILNGVPTGVEVALAMHHGGPYPATTDSRFTAVGADGIKRFARPVCFQNWSDELLPDELKGKNPLGLWRVVDNLLTKEGW